MFSSFTEPFICPHSNSQTIKAKGRHKITGLTDVNVSMWHGLTVWKTRICSIIVSENDSNVSDRRCLSNNVIASLQHEQ